MKGQVKIMASVKKTKEEIMAEYGVSPSAVSSHDMKLYDFSPQAFESVIANKNAFAKAQAVGDKQGMRTANDNANRVRSTYSQYTAGSDGMGYTVSPKYELNKPTYTSAYQGKLDSALNKVLNRGEFSNEDYDLKNDPVWQSLSKQYKYHGDRAYSNALAGGAGKTGGYASSADKYTAQMAQNAYMQELGGFIPQLYEAAYKRYADETKNMSDRLQLLRDIEAADYGRYRDDVSDWEKTRDYYNKNYMWQTERDDKLMQAAYENAMNKFTTTGVADSNVADVLKMAAGTQTADYNLAQQKINNEERWNEDASKQGWAKINNDERWNADSSNQAWAKIDNETRRIESDEQAQNIANAVKVSEAIGAVPPQYAAILGVSAGTPTSDARFKKIAADVDRYNAETSRITANENIRKNKASEQVKQAELDFEKSSKQAENEEKVKKNAKESLDDVPKEYYEMMNAESPEKWLADNSDRLSMKVWEYLTKMLSEYREKERGSSTKKK